MRTAEFGEQSQEFGEAVPVKKLHPVQIVPSEEEAPTLKEEIQRRAPEAP